jgi:hypothetical protein
MCDIYAEQLDPFEKLYFFKGLNSSSMKQDFFFLCYLIRKTISVKETAKMLQLWRLKMEEVITLNPSFLKMFRSLSIALLIIGVGTLHPSEANKGSTHLYEKQEVCKVENTSPVIEKLPSARLQPNTIFLLVRKAEQSFRPIIMQVSIRHNVDPALVKAIILAESRFNPKAVSYKGARGLMQLMPRTARGLGVDDIFNPEHNINGGVKYFKRLLDRFDGDVKLALAAYNAGTRKVLKYNGVPPYNQTKKYIKKVFFYYEYYKEEMARETTNA